MARPYPDHPYLQGNFAPIRTEMDAPDLVVRGTLPPELNGTLYRIGPDPQFAPRDAAHHWFSGDGMIHAFDIREGRVAYRNRWVRTPKWQAEHEAGEALFGTFGNPMTSDPRAEGIRFSVANTNIVPHGGKLLAIDEGSSPFEVEPGTIASLGHWTFGGAYEGPMTAHPKIDAETGEMLFFGYHGFMGSAEIAFAVADKAGRITRQACFDGPFPAMVHDFAITEEDVIFPIFPATISIERAMEGGPPVAWEKNKGSHIGIMPRGGTPRDMRWFEGEGCFVFHPLNAYRDGDRVIMDVMKYAAAPGFPPANGGKALAEDAIARLCRWSFDLGGRANTFEEEALDEAPGEFPRLDERRTGRSYRHGFYATAIDANGYDVTFDALAHVDLETGRKTVCPAGRKSYVSEPVFVPRGADAGEGDGWLLATVYREEENRSDLIVVDARDLEAGPVAVAELTTRVPFGFHGNWVGRG